MTKNDIESKLLAGSVPPEALQLLSDLAEDQLKLRLKKLGLAPARQQLLFDLIREKKEVDFYEKIDIQRYVLKKVFPEEYGQLRLGHHLYSSGDLYEFDPAKNGENMMKHGFNFAEVVSYSKNFGIFTVVCPDEDDGTRYVMFSTVDSAGSGQGLEFPMPAVQGHVGVMSIGTIRDSMKFRFISARFLSPNSYKGMLAGAFKNVYKDDPVRKAAFQEECVSKIEALFFSSSKASSSP